MANSLRYFWSYTLNDGQELMLEQPVNCDSVITQVSLADPANNSSTRVTLTVSVETLQIDKPKINDDFQAINYESVIASFCQNDQPTKLVNVGFTSSDICYVRANGGSLVVSGYVMPSRNSIAQFQQD